MLLPTIETRRLIIRQFVPEDWPAVFAYSGDPAVMRYMEEGVHTAEQARAFVAESSGADARAFAIVRRDTAELIGHLVFHDWYAPRTAEIGWALHPAHQRRGYVTEAARALLAYAFETLALHRVIATCQPENPASFMVMEKLGMRREGWFRKCIHRGGDTWWDELFYAILAEEWRTNNPASDETSERFYQAALDPLTGLANRALFLDRLRQQLAQAQRTNEHLGVLYLEIDGLQQIGDQQGRRASDAALTEIATRLRRAARQADTVARIGDDRFAIILFRVAGREVAQIVCHRLAQRISAPFQFGDLSLQLEAGTGLALFPDDAPELDMLLEQANRALHAARKQRQAY